MRRYLTVAACLGYMAILTLPFKLTAQVHPKASRYHLSMDRDWKFFLGDDKNASTSNFNDVAWRQLDLPHDWSIEGTFNMDAPTGHGGGYLPAGIGWYRKTFQLPAWVSSKQVNIQFDGIYKNSAPDTARPQSPIRGVMERG